MLYTIHPFPSKVNTMNYVFDGFLQVVFHDWEGRDNCFLCGAKIRRNSLAVCRRYRCNGSDNAIAIKDSGKSSPTMCAMEVP